MATNYGICGLVGANTGSIDCDVTKGVPVQIIPGSASFAPADYASQATFQAAFLSKIKQASGASTKLFPFPVIQGNTPRTTAAKTGTLGYGLEVKLGRSKQGYEFDVLAGSRLEKNLIKFDGKIIPLFIFDDQSNIGGVLDSALNFKGARYLIGVEPRDYGDANNAKTTKITISIVDSRDFVENYKFASTTFTSNDLVGLNDAVLFETAAHASNVYHIGAKIVTDEINTIINLHDIYPTVMAAAANWVARTGLNYATPLAITSVTSELAGWVVTFDTTAYAALPSGTAIRLGWVDPPALDALDVDNLEMFPIILVK